MRPRGVNLPTRPEILTHRRARYLIVHLQAIINTEQDVLDMFRVADERVQVPGKNIDGEVMIEDSIDEPTCDSVHDLPP